MIGKALIVAWSFTMPNLGPTPQIINAGPAPTNDNYVPVEAIIKNLDAPIGNNLVIS